MRILERARRRSKDVNIGAAGVGEGLADGPGGEQLQAMITARLDLEIGEVGERFAPGSLAGRGGCVAAVLRGEAEQLAERNRGLRREVCRLPVERVWHLVAQMRAELIVGEGNVVETPVPYVG